MKQLQDSAIERHYLQSVLPHPTYPIQKPFVKNKDFYRPEEFIWNNPHRASHHMYKFYHAYNDHYLHHKDKLIKQLEQNDREEAERQRISRLIQFRNRTRDEFFEKQRSRIRLQEKVHDGRSVPEKVEPVGSQKLIRPERKTTKTDFNALAVESHYHPLTQIFEKPPLHDSIQPRHTHKPSRDFKTHRTQPKSQRLIKIEEGYKQGLKKYDIKTEEVYSLIQGQNAEYHDKLRADFLARKMSNDQSNSRLYQKVKKFTIE